MRIKHEDSLKSSDKCIFHTSKKFQALLNKIMDTITAEDYQISVSVDEPKNLFPLQLESFYAFLFYSFHVG